VETTAYIVLMSVNFLIGGRLARPTYAFYEWREGVDRRSPVVYLVELYGQD